MHLIKNFSMSNVTARIDLHIIPSIFLLILFLCVRPLIKFPLIIDTDITYAFK